jgi:hypothetical protein
MREGSMDLEALIVAQIVRLFRERPTLVWELVEASGPPRPGDVPIRDLSGSIVAYARPVDR